MSESRYFTGALGWPSLLHARGRLLGLPFVLLAIVPAVAFGPRAGVAALLIATLTNFLVYLPLTVLALNGGAALPYDAPAPKLTPLAYLTLLVLWIATAWCAAAAAAHLG
jgi:hypothetical protein